MARRVPVKTALVGLLFAPGAMAQQAPDQNAQAPDPAPPPNENKPADPNAAPATMQPVTVTGSRPSEDFQVTKTSINRLGAADLMDVPQSVIVINKALMESQGATSLQSAIRNVPGVTIGAAEGGTIGNNFNINGFSARTDLYHRGVAYGIPGEQVDGMDVVAVHEAAVEAAEHARAGQGPIILEMLTYRYRGHSMSDPAKYRTKDEVNRMRTEHDPIDHLRQRLLDEHRASEDELKQIEKRARDIVAEAAQFAQDCPEPDPSELWTDVLAEA